MALFRDGAPAADDWALIGDGEALPAAGPVAVGKVRFLAERERLLARSSPIGLVLHPGASLEGLDDDIARLSLIVLYFPKFTDGRPYSLARILRDRHGYAGELRAAGEVLQDQIGFLLRAGFDAFEVTHPGTIAALAQGRVRTFRHHYQPASARQGERSPGPRPWLRASAGA